MESEGKRESQHKQLEEEIQNLPMISVIVPVYNIIDYLPRCVYSIIAQTWDRLELLLIDDGSTDGTEILCDELAKQDGRIRVFHKENGGSSSARNIGIRNALGEYLGFVDSDDYIEPDMYERLISAALETGARIVQIGRDEVDAEGKALPDICIPPKERVRISNRDFLRELLLHKGDCSFCTKLIHKDCFHKKSFPEGVLNEDFHLMIEMLQESGDIISLPGHAYHVFYRIGSNTRKEDKNNFSRVYGDCVDNADIALKLVKEQYQDLIQEAYRFSIFQRLEYLLHIPVAMMNRYNSQYRNVVRWLRKNWLRALWNPYLTGKNKVYHTLFAIAPRGIRIFHKKLKQMAK